MTDFEFYETPQTFTRWLLQAIQDVRHPIYGRILEPCVGSGAIVRAAQESLLASSRQWVTNDIDPRWPADSHFDARELQCQDIAWTVSNPPFTPAIEIIERMLEISRYGVAMHLRASIHEVLKTGIRRTWMAKHQPTGILWLPRFAYQRSKKTGEWTTDSVCACWVIWMKAEPERQFIRYAPEWVIEALNAETPAYRTRMDAIMADRKVA